MSITQQNEIQIKNTLSSTYKELSFILKSDKRPAGITVNELITNALQSLPMLLSKLIDLRQNLYNYQDSLEQKILLATAEKFLLSIKSIIIDDQLGNISLSTALAKENVYAGGHVNDYLDILNNIKTAVAAVTGDFTKKDLILIIARTLNAESNEELIHAMEVGIEGSDSTPADMKNGIANIPNYNSAPLIALYTLLKSGITGLTAFRGTLALSTDITTNHIRDMVSYSDILTNIKTNVSSLAGNFSKNDIAVAITYAINATSDSNLINYLELDFDNSITSAADMQSFINSTAGTDGPTISSGIYKSLLGDLISYLFSSSGAGGSSTLGAITLSKDITSHHTRDNVEYSDILTSIKTKVEGLTEDLTYNSIASAIATAINATSDTLLISYLEADLGYLGNSTIYIQGNMTNVAGTDGPSIANSFYNTLGLFGASAIQGILILNEAILNEHILRSTSYENIVINIKNTVSALPQSCSFHDVAQAIANSINYSDGSLASAIEDDLILWDLLHVPTLFIIDSLMGISGTDSSSITVSLYRHLGLMIYDILPVLYLTSLSRFKSLVLLTKAIEDFYSSNGNYGYVVTETSAIGSKAIGPKADTYLNKCTLSEEIFTVGGSVFNGFDQEALGPLLSAMPNLNTITGNLAALAQCGTWVYNTYPLYASTTYPAGVTGNAEDTGCKIQSAEMAGALCYKVLES